MNPFRMPGTPFSGALPPVTDSQRSLARELEEHVYALATDIGERSFMKPHTLDRAEQYLKDRLKQTGRHVTVMGYQHHSYTFHNLEIEVRGTTRPQDVVIVGAHYDSHHGSPGADDNATGVAAMLHLARLFCLIPCACTLRFTAFVNEEPPFFQTESMGSLVYARRCRKQKIRIRSMLSLESLGYYSEEPHSQRYPFPMDKFYPDTGNFIAFVGNLGSRRLVKEAVGLFREHAAFPSEGAVLPGLFPGVGWSDQWSFWKCGFPALMVTDTVPFRYPHYHTPKDTSDKIDFERMARVTGGLEHVVRGLAER